jgi:hypothetical protein
MRRGSYNTWITLVGTSIPGESVNQSVVDSDAHADVRFYLNGTAYMEFTPCIELTDVDYGDVLNWYYFARCFSSD